MKNTLTLILATAAVAAANASAQTARESLRTHVAVSSPAKHMLYRISGPNGATVYLLGSVHLLSADAATLPPEVDSAFAHAKSLTFETSLDSAKIRGPELLMRGRFGDGRTLRTALSPAAVVKTDSILHLYGLSIDQVNQFKPWLVSMVVAQLAMQKTGLQPQYGVDMQLNERAKQAQKPLLQLESVDFQLGMLDALAPADQERLLTDSEGPEAAAKELAAVRDAWSRGDAMALDTLINRRMAEAPAILDAMLTSRNRAWIPKLEAMINGHDDALVVVGAGHLVGKQGVVEMLRAKGYRIEQM